MDGHSRLGGSGIHRIIGCPGSLALTEKLERGRPGKAASTGTAAHALGELCLKEDVSPWDYEGKIFEADGLKVKADAKMCEGVEVYVGYIWGRMEELGEIAELEIEKEFHLKDLNEEMWGTADAVISQPYGLLEVIDYKNGFNPVEIYMNAQMLFYALGAEAGEDYSHVRITVVQPNALHKDGKVRSFDLTIGELHAWRDDVLMPAVELALKPGAPLQSGSHCLFCDAAGLPCPQKDKETTELLEQHFDVVTAGADIPPVDSLDFSRLEEIHLAAPMIKKFLDSCAVQLQARLEMGERSEHFMLVSKKGNRAWIDEETVESLMEPYGEEVSHKKVLLTPAQMEASLAKVYKEEGKKGFKKKAEEFLSSFWEKPDRGEVIAPRTSVRKEKGPSAIAEFMKDDPLFD